jgi:myo-inositol-1(or 4)-monophosphatase
MIDILKKAAREGGKVLLNYFQKELEVSHKTSHQNIVTQADTESQQVIQQTIVDMMLQLGCKKSEIGFMGEEDLTIESEQYVFVIDPLDGTANFACGLDEFSIFIACVKEKTLISSVVYFPAKDMLYYAEKGKGAFRESKGEVHKLTLEAIPLKNGLVNIYLSTKQEIRDDLIRRSISLIDHMRGLRAIGLLGATHLLEGQFAVVMCGREYAWDIAASKLLVEEAGGVVCDFSGHEIILNLHVRNTPYQVLMCHPNNLGEILRYIR